MKSLFIILPFLLFGHLSANELQWVDEQIKAIKPPRTSISKAKINSIKNPFIFLKKKAKKEAKLKTKSVISSNNPKKSTTAVSRNKISKQTTSFSLTAIINKSALINGKWYKLQSKVGKYTLSKVDRTSVILKYKKKELLLSTRAKTRKLKWIIILR